MVVIRSIARGFLEKGKFSSKKFATEVSIAIK